jgi:hypothetical protein
MSSVLKLHPNSYSNGPSKKQASEDEDDEGEGFGFAAPQSMTIHVSGLIPSGTRPTRQAVITPTQRNSISSRRKVFFDEVVNLPWPFSMEDPDHSPDVANKPRIIYIRDYHTLAAYRHFWFGPLLSAVRARRQGAMNRASSSVANPTVIVFGISPPLLGRNSSTVTGSIVRSPDSELQWSEGAFSHRARERRLRERLNRWKHDSFNLKDELPPSPAVVPLSEAIGSGEHSQLVVVPVQGGLESVLGSLAGTNQQLIGRSPTSEDSDYFRTSVIVPRVRQQSSERVMRTNRRREINQIVIRMALSSVGGQLREAIGLADFQALDLNKDGNTQTMLDHWSNHLQEWLHMKHIADRAVASAIITDPRILRTTINLTPVTWADICNAWDASHSSASVRQAWIEETLENKEEPSFAEEVYSTENAESLDEVFESVKQDQNLSAHERRLLGCFVSPCKSHI